ncbi:MAG: hypothetical protein ACKORF_05210 [Micrococcales bacterium]
MQDWFQRAVKKTLEYFGFNTEAGSDSKEAEPEDPLMDAAFQLSIQFAVHFPAVLMILHAQPFWWLPYVPLAQ